MRYVVIDGKRYAMRNIHKLYKEPKDARRQTQLQLFELKNDTRPQSQASADGRYAEPLLFE